MVRVEGGNKEYLLWDYSGWTEIRLTAPGTLGVSMRGAIGQPSPLSMRQTTKSLREYMKGKGYPLA
jgi:hypothetical protein